MSAGNKRSERFIKRIMRQIDVPETVMPNMTHMEIDGNSEILIENCKGIGDYADDIIKLSAGRFPICIYGSGLELKELSASRLVITGSIARIEFTD